MGIVCLHELGEDEFLALRRACAEATVIGMSCAPTGRGTVCCARSGEPGHYHVTLVRGGEAVEFDCFRVLSDSEEEDSGEVDAGPALLLGGRRLPVVEGHAQDLAVLLLALILLPLLAALMLIGLAMLIH